MPETIQVPGPTKIQYLLANAGTDWETLGYSDNDNLPSVQFTDHQHEIKTSISGAVPEEIVLLGAEARIACALVKWNERAFDEITTHVRGGETFAIPGTRVVGNETAGRLFSLKLLGSDGSSWEFRNVWVTQDFVGDSQWGNRERVLTLSFRTIWYQAAESAPTPPWVYTEAPTP
jgi:hypothetical protein